MQSPSSKKCWMIIRIMDDFKLQVQSRMFKVSMTFSQFSIFQYPIILLHLDNKKFSIQNLAFKI
jgi:hypothetical protein